MGEVQAEQAGLAKVRAVLPQLPEGERRVAEWVLSRPEQVIYLPIAELARLADVSEATVVRLCRRLGFDGYSRFKISISREIARAAPRLIDDIRPQDSVATALRKLFASTMRTMEDVEALLEPGLVQQAVQILRAANRVEIYASGVSAFAALDAEYKLSRLGLRAVARTDPHQRAPSAALVDAQTAVLAISRSGETRDIVVACEMVKKKGASLVAITTNPYSRLARIADVVLPTAGEELPPATGIPSILAQVTVIAALFVALLVADYERGLEHIQQSAASLRALMER